MHMKLTEGVLESRRCVQVYYNGSDDTITVEVAEHLPSRFARSRTIPAHQNGWLFFFGRPLVERIRQAVIECDKEIEAARRLPSGLAYAAYAALYHAPRSNPRYENVQLPPLVGPPDSPPE